MSYHNLEDRLIARSVELPNGCWMWLGPVEENGYAKVTVRTAPRPATPKGKWVHRLAYEVFNCAEIPPGYDIDHRCHFRLCIHPNHIEPRLAAKNRSDGAKRGNARRRTAR